MLTWGITILDTVEIAKKNINVDKLDVWLGKKEKVNVHSKVDIYKTIKKSKKRYLKGVIEYSGPILAPIDKNQTVAKLKIYVKDELINEYDLYASESIQKLNIFSRLVKSVNFLIWGDV